MLNPLEQWRQKHGINDDAWTDLCVTLAFNPPMPTPAEETDYGETAISSTIRLEASKLGVSLWRNNSGVATNRDGRPVRFGLGNDSKRLNETMKSSDLIGLTSRGTFVAVEVKRPGWHARFERFTPRELAQWNFHQHVQRNYGVAGFATCWSDVELLLRGRI